MQGWESADADSESHDEVEGDEGSEYKESQEEEEEDEDKDEDEPESTLDTLASKRLTPFYHLPIYKDPKRNPFHGEDYNAYVEGALPPVHLGEIYQSRYRLVLKLGHGSYSTVWLAVDVKEEGKHVALKFLQAEKGKELEIHQLIAAEGEEEEDDYGREFVIGLLDSFHITRNGRRYCVLVSGVVIPLRYLDAFDVRLDLKLGFFQLARGLAFLHRKGVTHGDLWNGNIALKLPKHLDGFEEMHQLQLPYMIPVVPNSETEREYDFYPKYLVDNDVFRSEYIPKAILHSIRHCEDVFIDTSFQILDMSNAYTKPTRPIPATKRSVRAPEFTVCDLNYGGSGPQVVGGKRADIWSLACTVRALSLPPSPLTYWLTNFQMFQCVYGNRLKLFDFPSISHIFLRDVKQKMGPFPPSWNVKLPPQTPETTPREFWGKVVYDNYDGPWSEDELRGFVMLLRRMLRVDPKDRISIDKVVKDSWFDDVRDTVG